MIEFGQVVWDLLHSMVGDNTGSDFTQVLTIVAVYQVIGIEYKHMYDTAQRVIPISWHSSYYIYTILFLNLMLRSRRPPELKLMAAAICGLVQAKKGTRFKLPSFVFLVCLETRVVHVFSKRVLCDFLACYLWFPCIVTKLLLRAVCVKNAVPSEQD